MLRDLPFDIKRLHAAYAAGTNPQTVVNEAYRRVEAANDRGIFVHLIDQGTARAAAAELGPFDPKAKPLWGVPVAIKDNIDAAGSPTTAACPAYAYTADRDAFVVARLRQAGAILIGKTNLDQFATGLVGLRSPYPPPKNAFDPGLVPGGSSSGSAVAVARGIVSLALGTDTAGSGRVPAALNNVVGLKPSRGAISNTGVVPACRSLDTVSVFALTVEDAYEAFRVAAEFDPADPYARSIAAPIPGPPPPVFRVGVPDARTREFYGDDTHAAAFSAALDEVTAIGGQVVDVDFTSFFEVAGMLYEGAWVAERYTVIEQLLRDQPEAIHPVTRQVIESAERLSAADVFRGFYRLRELKRRVAPVLDNLDLLCVPSVPTLYAVADVEADPIGCNSRLGIYTNFANLLDLCGIAVPCPYRADGLPASVTLLARSGRDAQIAAIAGALHRRAGVSLGSTNWPLAEASAPRSSAASGEIALAVVGAHMSGLPLNGELTRLGGRFLRATKTAPCYRLYRLTGDAPVRPGLVRDETGDAIAVEVWGLPKTQLGAFIAGVPQPLCIGTLTLAGGETVKGFLCEAIETTGAVDISHFGGWRAFLNSTATPRFATEETSHAAT